MGGRFLPSAFILTSEKEVLPLFYEKIKRI